MKFFNFFVWIKHRYEADPADIEADDDKAFGVTNSMFVPLEVDTKHKDLSKASENRFKYLEKKKPGKRIWKIDASIRVFDWGKINFIKCSI